MTDRVRLGALERPHASRLADTERDYERIMAAHQGAVDEGADAYVDPRSGYDVFTAAWLIDRGFCCHRGCRHCPYEGA